MKQLIRRRSRVADSSQQREAGRRRRSFSSSSSDDDDDQEEAEEGGGGAWRAAVPEGHLPVCVGEEMERFLVRAELLSRPVFAELLHRSAEEYGYEQRGVLRIPCTAAFFRRVLAADERRRSEEAAELWFRPEAAPLPSSSSSASPFSHVFPHLPLGLGRS